MQAPPGPAEPLLQRDEEADRSRGETRDRIFASVPTVGRWNGWFRRFVAYTPVNASITAGALELKMLRGQRAAMPPKGVID